MKLFAVSVVIAVLFLAVMVRTGIAQLGTEPCNTGEQQLGGAHHICIGGDR